MSDDLSQFPASWQSLEPFEVPDTPAIDPPRGDWSPVVDISQDDSSGTPGVPGTDGAAGPAGPTGATEGIVVKATSATSAYATEYATTTPNTIGIKFGLPKGDRGPTGPSGPAYSPSGFTGTVSPVTTITVLSGLVQSVA